jgi:hypothetical protein
MEHVFAIGNTPPVVHIFCFHQKLLYYNVSLIKDMHLYVHSATMPSAKRLYFASMLPDTRPLCLGVGEHIGERSSEYSNVNQTP